MKLTTLVKKLRKGYSYGHHAYIYPDRIEVIERCRVEGATDPIEINHVLSVDTTFSLCGLHDKETEIGRLVIHEIDCLGFDQIEHITVWAHNQSENDKKNSVDRQTVRIQYKNGLTNSIGTVKYSESRYFHGDITVQGTGDFSDPISSHRAEDYIPTLAAIELTA